MMQKMNILTQRYDGPVTRVMSNSFGLAAPTAASSSTSIWSREVMMQKEQH